MSTHIVMTGPTAARPRRMGPPDGRRTGRASAGGRTGTWNKNSNSKLEFCRTI